LCEDVNSVAPEVEHTREVAGSDPDAECGWQQSRDGHGVSADGGVAINTGDITGPIIDPDIVGVSTR
jgi:hypothetical protein